MGHLTGRFSSIFLGQLITFFLQTFQFHLFASLEKKMKLAFLLGLLSVTMVMGKKAELAEMAEMTKMAEDSGDQRAAAERMDEEDAMEKRQHDTERSDSSTKCDASWISNSKSTCEDYKKKKVVQKRWKLWSRLEEGI